MLSTAWTISSKGRFSSTVFNSQTKADTNYTVRGIMNSQLKARAANPLSGTTIRFSFNWRQSTAALGITDAIQPDQQGYQLLPSSIRLPPAPKPNKPAEPSKPVKPADPLNPTKLRFLSRI